MQVTGLHLAYCHQDPTSDKWFLLSEFWIKSYLGKTKALRNHHHLIWLLFQAPSRFFFFFFRLLLQNTKL